MFFTNSRRKKRIHPIKIVNEWEYISLPRSCLYLLHACFIFLCYCTFPCISSSGIPSTLTPCLQYINIDTHLLCASMDWLWLIHVFVEGYRSEENPVPPFSSSMCASSFPSDRSMWMATALTYVCLEVSLHSLHACFASIILWITFANCVHYLATANQPIVCCRDPLLLLVNSKQQCCLPGQCIVEQAANRDRAWGKKYYCIHNPHQSLPWVLLLFRWIYHFFLHPDIIQVQFWIHTSLCRYISTYSSMIKCTTTTKLCGIDWLT